MPSSTKEASGTYEPGERPGGRLRAATANYRARPVDPFVAESVTRHLRLRGGETIEAVARSGNRGPALRIERPADVVQVNGLSVEDYLSLKPFDELIAIDPSTPIRFETPGGPLSMRVVDLLTPIGLGQRGLIVAAPRTGKTVLLQQMAAGIATNHSDVYMIVLLIDERPEEVTEMRRTVHGEVISSSNDENIASHVRIARLIIERAKRMVETGKDVVILLDSLTRLGRAFNADLRGSRRIMSGGLDIRALVEPKGIFGAARKVEHGGSLTILASALIDTGSRMDEVIFNEFKGTGNMEIVLCRELANMRIWPAIDLAQSGTRKEERLLTPEALAVSHHIRRSLTDKDPVRSMEQLLELLGRFPTNAAFVAAAAGQVGMR
jgi:transcription termination factor Rho